ncbi:MAG: hypothetical protein EWV40_12740 [Microcystis flos-aquae Mf_WU_F_19750830_S460]|uniref:Uncharacterized protein n=1 Tax=Microcystis flos-aquae Mf_WU_F_19750830_S460 TaxID=2486237 RepID=A0A552LKX2_9CHRO|nr:MAG: hypothetical protein EWV40_12740 [Microcystis flos-aquae Mf_WU_F_19750830_S460]
MVISRGVGVWGVGCGVWGVGCGEMGCGVWGVGRINRNNLLSRSLLSRSLLMAKTTNPPGTE